MVTLVNRAKMTTATTGTGTVTLGSAVDGYQTYASAGVTDGDVTRNVFEDGDAWEISTGTYTASGSTLTRTLVESSTGSLLNLSGEAVVYVSATAEDIKEPFAYNAVSGVTQALDVGSFNFFDAGTLTADTTISFTGVPTEAQWTYTADVGLASDWDLEVASYDSVSFSVSSQDGAPQGIFFKDDGTKMYVVGNSSDRVHQYTLSTAAPFTTTLPAAIQNPPTETVSINNRISYTFFTADGGTNVYLINEEVL